MSLRSTRWRLTAVVLVSAGALGAQTFLTNPLTTDGVDRPGLRIYGVSGFTGFSTVDQSWRNVVEALSGNTLGNLPSYSTLSGVSTSIGYRFGGQEDSLTNFSFLYSPSFSYTTYGQGWSSLTHTLSLSWTHKLAPRWHASASLSGFTGNFNQALFSPNSEQNVAGLSGTAEQLAGNILGGTTASAVISPQQRLFYGDRILSATATVGLFTHTLRGLPSPGAPPETACST